MKRLLAIIALTAATCVVAATNTATHAASSRPPVNPNGKFEKACAKYPDKCTPPPARGCSYSGFVHSRGRCEISRIPPRTRTFAVAVPQSRVQLYGTSFPSDQGATIVVSAVRVEHPHAHALAIHIAMMGTRYVPTLHPPRGVEVFRFDPRVGSWHQVAEITSSGLYELVL